MKKLIPLAFIISFTLCLSFAAGAQTANNQPAVKRNPEVIPTLYYDVSPPLRDMQPEFVPAGEPEEALPVGPLPPAMETEVGIDQALQSSYGPPLIPNVGTSFLGVGMGFTGPDGTFLVQFAPPDTNMAVGPNHIVQTINVNFAIFDKSGNALLGPRLIHTVWQGFGGGCEVSNGGDAIISYDRIADRWVISQLYYNSLPYLECIAVSTSPDPTGSYNRYAFAYGTDFPDYPKIGVWPDAYYITYNIFANGSFFTGGRVCALDRTNMLAGNPATQQCFSTDTSHGGLLAADLDGTTSPPVGSPEHIVGLGPGNSSLASWNFHVDFANPANSTFTGPMSIAVAPYTRACGGGTCIPQLGTSQRLDSLADRLMYRLAYRNFADHESLVTNHSITAGSGVGVRWYELRTDGSGGLAVFQQGTYAPDSDFRWMGSIAEDQQGDMGLGFSLSGTGLNPSIHYTGRLATDPLGDMSQGEGSIVEGSGSQSGLNRWGDYSAMQIDPNDDCTFWYTTEFLQADGRFNWSTQIASFTFPSCAPQQAVAFNVSAPASATAGNAFDVTVTAIDGAGNTVPSYKGTVTFTTTDPDSGVVVPADYTFTTGGGGDNGVHTFSAGFVLQTPGSQTITATDTVTTTITGNATVNVN